jgi:uncharacterized protein YcbK (DUF882 family)
MEWIKYAPYFIEREFRCRCGQCHRADMKAPFMEQLVGLRVAFNRPMVITSGFRCSAHNQRVSTTGVHGPHTTGLAADIQVSGPPAFDLIDLAIRQGFRGIGIAQKGPHIGRFIHLDLLNRPERTLWSY